MNSKRSSRCISIVLYGRIRRYACRYYLVVLSRLLYVKLCAEIHIHIYDESLHLFNCSIHAMHGRVCGLMFPSDCRFAQSRTAFTSKFTHSTDLAVWHERAQRISYGDFTAAITIRMVLLSRRSLSSEITRGIAMESRKFGF